MIDKSSKDDEYQFPADEYLEESSEVKPADENAGVVDDSEPLVMQPPQLGFFDRYPFFKNMKFIFFVLVIIVIIIGVLMMRSKPKVTVISQKKAVPAQITKVSQPDQQVFQQQQALNAAEEESKKSLNQVTDTMGQLSEQLNSVVAVNTQLGHQVMALTQEVNQLNGKVKQNTNKLEVTPKKKIIRAMKNRPKPIIYHINAIISGRAWLKGSGNQFISVASGDDLGSYYGKVKAIDTTQGKVITSSGKVIGYGDNDY